jgi:hypothetical protein
MSMLPIRRPAASLLSSLQAGFLAIVPRIRRHGQVAFRHLKCAGQKEDAIAEMIGLCWKWFIRLAEQGKDGSQFPSALATYAARAVHAGRRLCGQERAKDVLSPRAQRRCGFRVRSLPDFTTLGGNPLEEALADNTVTPVDEQVAFRLDFPAWLQTQSDRKRRIALDLMAGERTLDVADKYALSPGRISQMRTQFRDDWIRFQNGPPADDDRVRVASA